MTDLPSPCPPEETINVLAALNSIPHGFCVYDSRNRLIFVNEGFSRIYRYAIKGIPAGTHFFDVLAKSVALGNYSGRSVEEIWMERKAFIDRRAPGVFLQALGDGRLIAITHRPLANGGWVAVYEDVTERRREETHLHYMAHHDSLTGLPNRHQFHERLHVALRDIEEGGTFALLSLDLDGFKAVNDHFGHAAGDALLCQVAERLRTTMRTRDIAARIGGDEFAILLLDAARADAQVVAERVERELSVQYDLSGRLAAIGTSVGFALAPADGRDAGGLLAVADADLYRTKRTRHQPTLNSSRSNRWISEDRIR